MSLPPPNPEEHHNKAPHQRQIRGPYRSYRHIDKSEVLKYVSEHGVSAAAKQFHIPDATISDWKNYGLPGEWKDDGKQTKLRAKGGGAKTILPLDVENLLYCWYRGLREDGVAVARGQMLLKAQRMYNGLHPEEPHELTVGWLDSFLRRWDISVRKKTGDYKNAAQEHMRPIQDFWLEICTLRLTGEYPLNKIGNMDQTPVWQDMINDHTLEDTGIIIYLFTSYHCLPYCREEDSHHP